MQVSLLADCLEAVPKIARWYFDQWGRLSGESGPGEVEKKLRLYLNRDRIPLVVVASDDDVVGVAQLKYREMEIYPDREHWLGGVYVPEAHRGRGIATRVVGEVVRIASTLGVHTLHLQTERLDGGLYARLGWKPANRVNNRGIEVLVMEKPLDP